MVATVTVAVPPGQHERPLLAGLKSAGRIIARGSATTAFASQVAVPLRLMDAGQELPAGDYELWITLDRDGWLSCYPGFGDLAQRVPWEITGAAPTLTLADPARWQERKLSAPANLLTIHYHRYDDDYDDVGLWTWDSEFKRTPAENELFEVGRDDYGLVFQLDRGLYGNAAHGPHRIGLLPRLASDWGRKDGEDRYWTPDLGDSVHLIGTRNQIWGPRPDLAPHVAAAFLDGTQRVVIQLSQLTTAAGVPPAAVAITDDAGNTYRPVALQLAGADDRDRSNYLEAILFEPLDVMHRQYHVRVDGYRGAMPALPRAVLDDPALFCDDTARLGAFYTPEGTTFRVFAPAARTVQVVLYNQPRGNAGRAAHPLTRQPKGIWETTVAGDLLGRYYTLAVTDLATAVEREVVDIYATNTVDSTRRARITDLAATNPPGWEQHRHGPPLASPVDMIVYELHVRDFTIGPGSPASPAHRGKYLGFAEAVDHLADLGVTHVQLLPVQDFENNETDPDYNWGYMTAAYLSPEGWYATNLHDDSRIREFKRLVHALHERGIGVILDVVYNHTGHAAGFNTLAPHYYYRFNADGSLSNGSGCGNDFRSESPMGRKFIIDSLKYWVTEYGIDGFRFDLMAMLDLETMKEVELELRHLKPQIVLYGEPWSAGPTPLKGRPTDKHHLRGTSLGAFNDTFRNALKGSPDGAGTGFIQDGAERETVVNGLMGSWTLWAPSPAHAINYLTCHDNLVLFDKLKVSRPDASEAAILEMMKLAYLLLFTAQGVPFLHGGEEFARTKHGHHNSYNAPDAVNQIDWRLKTKHQALVAYVRDLIALRKAHPAFRLRTKEQVAAALEILPPADPHVILFTLDGAPIAGEPWQTIGVIANADDDASATVELPDGRWFVAFDHTGKLAAPRVVEEQVAVRYKSGMILYQPRP